MAQSSYRLTVRPHEMATGTINPAAGEYQLDSAPGYLVSVPQQCTGAHRCPMFVFLPPGYTARVVTDWLRPVADKYGMILLAANPDSYDTDDLDRALKQTLRRFAIDPDKIAIIGRCGTGGRGAAFGIDNLDVFSRIAVISGGTIPVAGIDPNNKTAEFLLDGALSEGGGFFPNAQALRRAGHPVKVVLGLRTHDHQMEDYDQLGRWLKESWATPGPAARTAASVVADPVPELTVEVVKQMTTFWTSFSHEPDSIRTTARRAHLREVAVPVGQERPSVVMMDMSALAASYPSVAADLKSAGLTAQQHDAYRVALVSARIAKVVGDEVGPVEPTSTLAKNIAFMDAHPQELRALEIAGVVDPELKGFVPLASVPPAQVQAYIKHAGTRPNPKAADDEGPMGMWRTP